MKIKPITFGGPMVLAIIDGRKTQTRRVSVARVRPCPDPDWTPPKPLRLIETKPDGARHYENDVYSILVRPFSDGGGDKPGARIQIFRWDGSARRDWRDEQWIKNQLFGIGAFAVEIYPAESDLRDPSNAFYLWVFDKTPSWAPWTGHRIILSPDTSVAPQRGWSVAP